MSTLSPISVSFDEKGFGEPRHETSAEIPDLNVTTALKCEKDGSSTSESGHYSSESDQNEVDSSSSPVPTARFQLNPYYKKSRLLSQQCSISSPRSAGNHALPSINKSSPRTYLDPASSSSTSPVTRAQAAMSRSTPSLASISPGSNLSNVSPDFHRPGLSEATQPIMATPTPSMSDKTQSAPATPGRLPCNSLSVSSAAPRPSSVTPIPRYNSPRPNYDPTSPSYDPTSPNYDPTSPSHDSHSPSYNPHSPIYDPPSPGCYGTPNPGCYTTPSPSSAIPSPSYNPPSPNYNPPSPSYNPPSPNYNPPSPSYDEPSPSYNPPSPSYDKPSPNYNPPSPGYDEPSPSYNPPSPNYNPPSPSYDEPSPNYNPPSPGFDQPSPNYNPPSPSYDQPSPNYNPTNNSYDQLSPNYNPPSPSYDQLSPNCNPSPSYSPLSPRYSPHSPSHSPLSPGYDSPTPGYDTPSPGCFDLFSPSCYSVPSPGCYDTLSPSYDPPSPSYDPPSPSTYNPPSPSTYNPPSPTYDPPSPNLSYDPTRSDSGAPTSVYDPPSPICYNSSSSSEPPSPSPSNETSATLVPSPQKSLSPLSPSVSPSKMSSQSSDRSSSEVSNGSSASSSKFSTRTSSCTKHSISPSSSKSSTSSKHSQSSVSSYSSTECRTPDVSPGASPISQSSPTSFPPSANNSSINRSSSASNSSPEFTVRGCSPLISTSPKNSSSAPSEGCNIDNNAKSTVSSGGIASSPSSMDGIASSPSSSDGIASSPSSIVGIASSPSSMDGIASSPSSIVGISSSPSSSDGIASSPSSSDGLASSPSSIVGIAFSPWLNQSPQSIVNAVWSSTSNCSQLPDMTVLDGGMQMSSSPTKTSGATQPSLPLPSTVSNRPSKRKFWEHEIDHVKKLKTENGKIRLICMEAEYIKQNNENRKDLTHIGCSILCVDKSGSLYQEGNFFRVIEPPRMKDYLSMKMKGDLLKSLHIQQNETLHFEFRDEFEIIDDQNKRIECVTEDKALKDFNDFISKFHPYVIISLDEEIVKIILAKVQGISNISPFSRSPWISWTQILRQLNNVSREDIVMEFEDWFIKNMNPQDSTISPQPHALDISTMLMKAIKHVAIKKNGNFYQTLSAASFPSIESLRSSTNAAICSEKFEYIELFNSLRPNMTTTIYFESVDVIDLSSDSDDDQAKVTPISWSILSNANQNTTQSWSHPQFNFPAHLGLQVSPWASGYYTGGNLPIRHDDYFSNANLQARLINRNALSSFPGYLTNGPSSHQGAGPFYPQHMGRERIPPNQNTPWSAYSRPLLPSRATVPNQTSNENGAAVAREGTPLNPSQCTNLNKRFTIGACVVLKSSLTACGNKRKMSCAFKMCKRCCRSEKRNEPCSGHGRR